MEDLGIARNGILILINRTARHSVSLAQSAARFRSESAAALFGVENRQSFVSTVTNPSAFPLWASIRLARSGLNRARPPSEGDDAKYHSHRHPAPIRGRWGLAVLANCAANAAENKALGRVGSRIAIMTKEEN